MNRRPAHEPAPRRRVRPTPVPALPVQHGVRRIVSGGQTGVDQGALDAALALGLEHGGWCPRGRFCEDGRIPERFRLRETESAEYRVRTERNVIESDGTLILYRERIQGGTSLTRRYARERNRPHRLVDLTKPAEPDEVRAWLVEHSIATLNVAGPRESSSPGIYDATIDYLRRVFAGA